MLVLSIVTICFVLISLVVDRRKTWNGIKKGIKMFLNLLPTLFIMLVLVSIVLYLIPEEKLAKYMGDGSGIAGWVTAALFGSVALIPGFIAYPLCGILVKSGVAYSVIAVFITTLMMTGFLTLPVEAKFFGWKISIMRNLISLAAALLIGLIMGFFL
ncbi:MAG: permease [Bacteroidota bacterium]